MIASDNQKGVPTATAATPAIISSDGRMLLTIINASKKCEEQIDTDFQATTFEMAILFIFGLIGVYFTMKVVKNLTIR